MREDWKNAVALVDRERLWSRHCLCFTIIPLLRIISLPRRRQRGPKRRASGPSTSCLGLLSAELVRQELATLREEDRLTPDLVFRDPYLLNFLGLADTYSEKDLEAAILRDIQQFILEPGAGFAFIDRQKRVVIDNEDFYIVLLFYHRRLRRLVAVDLKLGKFQAADKGQMELYLRWLERNETEPGEQAPLGLILCADKGDEQVELLQLDKSGIRVATYLTELPSRRLLEQRLHEAVKTARVSLSARQSKPS